MTENRRPGFFEGTEMPTAGWWDVLWPDPASVLRRVGLKPGMGVIDLCSGNGWFTLPIATIARQVIAVDIDPEMLDAAHQRLAGHHLTNGVYRTSDAYDVAGFGEQADFVFMANAFHGVPDRPRLAWAVRRVLKPGGLFAIVNWHKRPREETVVLGEPRGPRTELRLSPDETVAAVETAGLRLGATVEIPPYHYGVTFSRP